jgi:hypothetical protein
VVVTVGILWVVLTPYWTGLLVAWSRPVNRVVTRHIGLSTTIGWLAVAALLSGVFAIGGTPGMAIAIAAAPFVGLAFWTSRSDPGRDDDGGPPPDDHPPEPDAIRKAGVRLSSPRRTRPAGHRPAPRTRMPARTP